VTEFGNNTLNSQGESYMKKLFTLASALALAIALTACGGEPAETETTTTTTTKAITTTTTVETTTTAIAAATEEAAAEETTAATTTTTASETTTTAPETQPDSSITGTYRSVEPAYPEGTEPYDFDYINIDQMDDGRFQVEFRLAIGGSGNDFAVFDSEALGAANWYSFYFDGDMGVPYNNGLVTVTADGNTAWVTYEGGEPQEFVKVE
jgi:hypothetical protein